MRLIYPKSLILLPCLFLVFCFSCAPKYGAYFSKPTYEDNNYVNNVASELDENFIASVEPRDEAVIEGLEQSDFELLNSIEIEPVARVEKREKETKQLIEGDSNGDDKLSLLAKEDRNATISSREEMIMDALRIKLSNMTKADKRAFRKEVVHLAKSNKVERLSANNNLNSPKEMNEPSTNTVLLVILAILLPPLAVFLHEGEVNKNFWINLLLTLLLFIPGIIHALIIIL